LKLRLTGEERTQLAQRATEDPEAHRFYLEGRFWWNRRSREGHNRAIELFNKAIRLDPDFALAYAGKRPSRLWQRTANSPRPTRL
jgi:serine/threonine-protein kinase